MNEMQQILEAIKRLEKGQESIRAEMATKSELATLNKKFDSMQSDITAIKKTVTKIDNKVETGSSMQSDEENAVKARLTAVENKVSILMRSHSL